MRIRHHFTLWQVFRAPVFVAICSLFGLIAALLGDGVWNGIGAAALATSVVATAWAVAARRR